MVEQSVWHEGKDGIIRLTLTSDGTSGPEWVKRLWHCGVHLSPGSLYLLHSPDFKPTSGVTVEIAVVRRILFPRGQRSNRDIVSAAAKRKFRLLHPEMACLLREKISNKDVEDMGLWWIFTMHEPIKDDRDDPRILIVGRERNGCLSAEYYDLDSGRDIGDGLAFGAS
jgi:hypothetical protein